MKPIILRDDTENLGEIKDHEEPIFHVLDLGYPKPDNICQIKMHEFIKQVKANPPFRFWNRDIEVELCQSTGVPKSYLIQSPKNRPGFHNED